MQEQTKSAFGEADEPTGAAESKRTYERSTIEFPYNDLGDAVEIVRAVHRVGGMECELDALAAALGQSMTSGGFRGRVSNAGTFRLTENERGRVRLTELGCEIMLPDREAIARVASFLAVPLYAKLYERYKGYTLPPPSALEREMVSLGVAQKQTDKARQAFMRSARHAGFFVHGEDRLVRPQLPATPATRPIEQPAGTIEKKGGGEPPDGGLHPFILGLLKTLPEPGTDWAASERAKWLQTAASIFGLIYKGEGDVTITCRTPVNPSGSGLFEN